MLGIRFNTRQFYLAFYNLLVLISEVSCIALFGPQLPYNSGLGYGLLGNGILGLPVPFIPRYGNLGYGGFGWGPEDSTKSGRGKRSTDDYYNAYNNIYRSDENHGDSYSSKFKSSIPELSEDKPLELNEFYADLNKSIYVEDEGGNPNFNLLMAVPEFNNVYSYLSEAYGGNSLELDSDLEQLDNSDDSDSEDSDSEDSDSEDSDSEDSNSDDTDSDDSDNESDSDDSDNESDSDEDNEDSNEEDNEDSNEEDNEDSDDEAANEDSDDEAANEDSDDEAANEDSDDEAANEDSDDEAANEDSDDEAANEDSDEAANEDSVEAANEDSVEEAANADSVEEAANADSDEVANKDADSSNEHSGNSEGLVNGSNNFEGNNSQELDSRNSRHLDYYMRNMNTHARALPDPYDFSPIHISHNRVDLNNILVSGHYNHMESVEEMNPHDRTGRTERARQRPIYSSGYTPYNHYGDNDFLVSGHFVPEIGPGQVYSDFKTNEYW